MKGFLIILLFIAMFNFGCEKEITVELPQKEQQIVVEGHIEPNVPPYIILTKSLGYFTPTDIKTFQTMFIHNADVKVSDGVKTITLKEYCSDSIPAALLPLMAEFTGVSMESLSSFRFCIYMPSFDFSTLKFAMEGMEGKTYTLSVVAEGKTLTASTIIPAIVPLDDVWFKVQPGYDYLGYAWAKLADPDTFGNGYRWFAKRLNVKGEPFMAPFGSTFNDKFINGKKFDFAYPRPVDINSTKSEDMGVERNFYKKGDTIAVKFCTIDNASFHFYRSFEIGSRGNSNPFASPMNIESNIVGGIGIWGGYGVWLDTIIAK